MNFNTYIAKETIQNKIEKKKIKKKNKIKQKKASDKTELYINIRYLKDLQIFENYKTKNKINQIENRKRKLGNENKRSILVRGSQIKI